PPRALHSFPTRRSSDLDYLVRKGVAFRDAHHAIGLAVAVAEKKGKRLSELQLAELRSIHPGFAEDALQVFDLKKALAQRSIVGRSEEHTSELQSLRHLV